MTNETTIMGDAAIREDVGMNGGVVMHLAPSNSATSPAQLNDAVKRIAELDAKRTQGDWKVGIAQRSGKICIQTSDTWICGQLVNGNGALEGEGEANAAFIEAAPLMAATVAQQAAIIDELRFNLDAAIVGKIEQNKYIKQQREALGIAREAIARIAALDTPVPRKNWREQVDWLRAIAKDALAAIDNVMKGANWVEIKDGPMAGTFYHE